MTEIRLTLQNIEAVRLSAAAYSRGLDVDASRAELEEHIAKDSLFNGHEVRVEHYEDGDVILSARNLETGEITVVGRGTDEILEEGIMGNPAQWVTIAIEGRSLLGDKMTEVAVRIHGETGERVHLAGHSLAGQAAEQAAAALGAEVVASVTNVQGPVTCP